MSIGSRPGQAQPVALRPALATVHRDPRWWLKCLLYGALALTLLGLPISAGFVVESLDNSRRGYPTPLPLWSDWTTRALAGLFALLIDFAFFVLPLMVGGLVLLCASVGLLVAGLSGAATSGTALGVVGAICAGLVLAAFLASAAPAGRLLFVREGRPEDAIGANALRWALAPQNRGTFARARLASLPAYLPAVLFATIAFALARMVFPGQVFAVLAALWLTLSALVYAHLVVVQLYVAADKVIERQRLGM